jgi:hypothetical protein
MAAAVGRITATSGASPSWAATLTVQLLFLQTLYVPAVGTASISSHLVMR